MVSFSGFSRLVPLSIVLLETASSLAAPGQTIASSKQATHYIRQVAPGVNVTTFFPKSTYTTFGAGVDPPQPKSKRSNTDSVEELAMAFIKSHLGLEDGDITLKSSFNSDTTKHAYLSQTINGVHVANAVANVALNNENKIVSFGSNFVKPDLAPSTAANVSSIEAIARAESVLSAMYNDFPTSLAFLAKDDDSIVLTHVVQVQNDEHWYEAFVDAHTGELVSVHDFVAHASYNAIPLQLQSPLNGGFRNISNPQDYRASPHGWHSDGTVETGVTAGNNAIAYKEFVPRTSPETSRPQNFNYRFNPSVDPATAPNVDVARVNAFYVVNSIHDITYLYGFTESAFNFQNNNFDRGGVGNDRVRIEVQDSSLPDNAKFGTPPDGQSGLLRLGLFSSTALGRDTALDNTVVAHEMIHGVTNRMTGGGSGRCLQTLEASGLGEGWSDAFADWMGYNSSVIRDFTVGDYVQNSPRGLRTHPYSTSKSVNPLTYRNLRGEFREHNIGEVWANILHNVYAALVGVSGFSPKAKTDPTGTAGNVVFLHLFLDALAIQPCNPNFLDARDAWIQADGTRYQFANYCTLWKVFASRGLGVDAENHVDDGTVPEGC